jgi:hypothetical protein
MSWKSWPDASSGLIRVAQPWVALGLGFLLPLSRLAAAPGQPPEKVDFNFQVRPILADRCFKCHGPDEKARKAKLRLDQKESAYAARGKEPGTRAIVPGHPERSELWRRIINVNDDDRMPPVQSNLTLSDQEKQVLRHWIEQGAEYKPHWAFLPVGEVSVPRPPVGAAPGTPIDAFVLERLKRQGLSPSPVAPRELLIRRLSFDLRGLPPSLEEIDVFLADTSIDAYEKLVDRLLASPAYGEKQANEWLDLARFADTYGYQNDMERDLSPWRDWVIRAFNENLPYDQFITWQLAGDLFPEATRDQALATTFNRLHRQTNEGGSIDEEFRAEYVADRVATAGTAFLGLTLGCARCHDHKYDPVTQKDFYRMSAFFNNIDESGLYSHFTRAMPSPALLLYRAGEERKHSEVTKQLQEREAALAEIARAARARFQEWLRSEARTLPESVPSAAFSFDEISTNGTPDRMGTNRFAILVDGPEPVAGKAGKALKFSGDNSAICKGAGVFNRTSPFSFAVWIKPAEKQERAVVFHRSRAWSDSGSRGYELVLEDGQPAFGLIHFWPGNAIKVRSNQTLPLNQWSHLAVTYDGSSHASGLRLYLNGEPLALQIVRDTLFKDILHREEWGDYEAGGIELTLAGRFRDSGFKNGSLDEFLVFAYPLTQWEIRRLAGTAAESPDQESLFAYYAQHIDAPFQEALGELQKLREAENKLVNDVPEIMVMKEMTPKRPAHLLKRGAYDSPDETVEPGAPEAIFPFAKGLPPNRLGLAKWVVDPRNPLTARVAVNRAWRMHFGRGLVATEEDFGTQGKLPAYPRLLDWLARHFVEHGWDMKELHKTIVLSATYRQTSRASAELLAKDADNLLLARGPSHRLRAEEIRDNALAVSGLLAARVGGPSARPYQPEGLWEEAGTGKSYTQDKGEGLYRRSLYTFWKRTAPPPNMLVFDAPTREFCLARRETTSTPLQSLVLLNDPQFLEAARVWAEQLVRQFGIDVDARLVRGFRLATGRAPRPRETDTLRRLYHEQLTTFESHPKSAEQYLKIGDRPVDGSLPAPQVAATAAVTSALMNLDEFVMER